MALFASIVKQIRTVSKGMIRLEKSETIRVVVKILFFVLKQIFKKNCDGENKKG